MKLDDPDNPILWHTCKDGHSWRQQADGGVSPSWGFGGTSVHFDQAVDLCPEPERFVVDNFGREDDRGVECPSCGHRGLPFDMYAGLSCQPWLVRKEIEETGHEHLSPLPVCGKPPVKTLRWEKVGKGKKARSNWVDTGLEFAAAGQQGALC